MTSYAEPSQRTRLIVGRRDLAVFLETYQGVPAPLYATVYVFPIDGPDDEKRGEIDVIASRIGAEAHESASGHYTASRSFGPVEYRAVAICQPRSPGNQKERRET